MQFITTKNPCNLATIIPYDLLKHH
uniref:Uncharacterized protein n=1 Tax=Arundo donax TaxID=35708 RepID=A0A0A9G9X2_ARUDO